MNLQFIFNWLTYTMKHCTPLSKKLSTLTSISQKGKKKKNWLQALEFTQGIQYIVS